MIHSLLNVCLLTMGVGAKASTPIELNRQQTQYENNNNLTFTNTFNPSTGQEFNYRTVFPGQLTYGLFNWSWKKTTGTTNQYTFSNIQYTNEGKLVVDTTNPNDTWEYAVGTFSNDNLLISNYYDKMEVLSITPTTTVYNTKITKNVGTNLVTSQNINAQFTIKLEVFYSNTGSLDQFKEYQTGDNVDGIIKTQRLAINNIQMYEYTYEEKYMNFEINENTPTTGIYEDFEFNIPLVKDTNTVIVMFYRIICTNYGTSTGQIDSASRVYDARSTSNNGRYSQATRTEETTISGNWSTAEVHQEVIDLPGLMWEILAMPFAFISTAFNLTLFPGTPYSLNITNLFMALILMAIIVYILKKVVKI